MVCQPDPKPGKLSRYMTATIQIAPSATFGDCLKHLRRRARLTQRELSIAVGYSEAQISRLEQNQRRPDLATLAASFVPALGLEEEAELAARLLELGAQTRGEATSAGHLAISRTVTHQVTEEIIEGDVSTPPPQRLPLPFTSFIGREQELVAIQRQLSGVRLVTLIGPGGCGKTRLALAVAARLTPPDGVRWVGLDTLTDPAMALQAVASVLGVKEAPGHDLLQSLAGSLQTKDTLLILDNCEHMVEACAQLVAFLLQACPKVSVLATSREPLNLPGEVAWLVPPLADSESVGLFVERARLACSGYAVTEAGLAVVGHICDRLDGLPLAIELAAARVRALSPHQIAARLEDAISLLTSNNRAVPPRHQTLQATLAWSYDLLDSTEKVLLNRLSVFVGGFTLEAVEAVTRDWRSARTLDALTRLVDKSLVAVEHSPQVARYRLLGVVQQYARARLVESGEAELIREWHAKFYLQLAERLEPKLLGGERAGGLARLEQEHANMRAALEWTRGANQPLFTLRLCSALLWFWHFQGYFGEGWLQIESALQPFWLAPGRDDPAQVAVLAKVAWSAGLFAWTRGDYAVARERFEFSLCLFRQGPPSEYLAHALSNLGMVALSEGNLTEAHALTTEAVTLAQAGGWAWALALLLYNAGAVIDAQGNEATARQFLEESRMHFRRIGDRWGQSISLVHLGLMAARWKDYALARELVEQALTLQIAEGDVWGRVAALALLGQISQRQANFSTARKLYSECTALIRDRVGDKATLSIALEGLGQVAGALGEPQQAAQYFAGALSLQMAAGGSTPLSLTSREDLVQNIAAVRATLAEAEFEAAWRQGQALVTTLELFADSV